MRLTSSNFGSTHRHKCEEFPFHLNYLSSFPIFVLFNTIVSSGFSPFDPLVWSNKRRPLTYSYNYTILLFAYHYLTIWLLICSFSPQDHHRICHGNLKFSQNLSQEEGKTVLTSVRHVYRLHCNNQPALYYVSVKKFHGSSEVFSPWEWQTSPISRLHSSLRKSSKWFVTENFLTYNDYQQHFCTCFFTPTLHSNVCICTHGHC